MLDRSEFNEMRLRLPRAACRDVQAPASLASEGLRKLEQRLAEKLA